ncbi:hypothetical protein AB0N06_32060 [Streptomyces sp. NPDC051020]|uniref:hypothetical protein n=1 Tax=Streptomyces sp. NPDC051020 TaxID=3155409 RepID=UPI003445C487
MQFGIFTVEVGQAQGLLHSAVVVLNASTWFRGTAKLLLASSPPVPLGCYKTATKTR